MANPAGMATGTTLNPGYDCACGRRAVLGSDKCSLHIGRESLRFKRAMYQFQTPALQQAFEMMLRADERYSLDEELALMRTCLQGVVQNCKAVSPGDMGPHTIAALTSLSSEIAKVCDVVSRLEQRTQNQVSMECILFFVQLIAEALTKEIGADKAQAVTSVLLELPLPHSIDEMRPSVNARQFMQPSGHNTAPGNRSNSNAVMQNFVAGRKAKIDDLRRQAAELRAQIGEDVVVDESMQTDAELAPAEPEEDSAV